MMESISATDEQTMVSSLLEIAVGQTAETARRFLQATSWKLDEALQLFYAGSEGGLILRSPSAGSLSPIHENPISLPDQTLLPQVGPTGDEVRAPLPVVSETLYVDAMLYGNETSWCLGS